MRRTFCLELSNCIRVAEEGMDGYHLLLVFVQVGSRVRQMSCSAPAAEDCLGYVHLSPSDVTNRADEAGRIIKTSHRLILFCTESPYVSTSSKVMWTGGVEVLAHRVRSVWRWETVDIGVSAGVPFRRRGHNFGGAWPIPILPSISLSID